jgi:hypothetical protein
VAPGPRRTDAGGLPRGLPGPPPRLRVLVTSSRRGALVAAILLVSGLKLWSLSQEELVVRDYPADDPWYLRSAAGWYWSLPYEQRPLNRQPGYPLWIAAAGTTGLPLRLSTEILFLAAAATFVLALARAGAPALLPAPLFALVAFHPFSYYVNGFPLVDSFYAPVLLLALAGMVLLLAKGTRAGPVLLTGLALAVLWHTRQENVLVLLYLLLLGGCAAWVRSPAAPSVRAAAQQALPVVLLPGAIVLASSLAVRTANLLVFGSFAEYEFATPAFQAAYRALLRIEPEPPLPGIPVPREVRRRVYAVSPTFRLLEPDLDGPGGRHWASFTATSPDPAVRGEISAGNFGWALTNAVKRSGRARTAADADALYRRIAAEIEAACDEGRLQCRRVPFGPLDPHLGGYLTRLPSSLARVGGRLVWAGEPAERRRDHPLRPEYVALANDVTNRRAALVTETLRLGGWAAHPTDPVTTIRFVTPEGGVLAVTSGLRSRPDLERYFRRRWGDDAARTPAAFDLDVPLSRDRLPAGEVQFNLASGATAALPLSRLREVALRRIVRIEEGPAAGLEYSFGEREGLEKRPTPQDWLQDVVHRWYGRAAAGLALLALVTLPLRLFGGRRGSRLVDAVTLLLVGVIAARVALFVVIDASSWDAADNRFLFPVAPLLPCAALIVLSETVRRLLQGRQALNF